MRNLTFLLPLFKKKAFKKKRKLEIFERIAVKVNNGRSTVLHAIAGTRRKVRNARIRRERREEEREGKELLKESDSFESSPRSETHLVFTLTHRSNFLHTSLGYRTPPIG